MHLEPEQTPVIVFYPVRLSVRLSELFLSFSQTPPGSESRENFYIFTPTWKCYLC